jgi:hypothetical protein
MRHLLLAATIILCACGSSSGGGSQLAVAGSPESLTYVPELKVDLASMTKRPSGLYLKDLAVGEGPEAVQGSTVEVHYTGWLASGLEFRLEPRQRSLLVHRRSRQGHRRLGRGLWSA